MADLISAASACRNLFTVLKNIMSESVTSPCHFILTLCVCGNTYTLVYHLRVNIHLTWSLPLILGKIVRIEELYLNKLGKQ